MTRLCRNPACRKDVPNNKDYYCLECICEKCHHLLRLPGHALCGTCLAPGRPEIAEQGAANWVAYAEDLQLFREGILEEKPVLKTILLVTDKKSLATKSANPA